MAREDIRAAAREDIRAAALYGRLSASEWAVWLALMDADDGSRVVVLSRASLAERVTAAEVTITTALRVLTARSDQYIRAGGRSGPKRGHGMASVHDTIRADHPVRVYALHPWREWAWGRRDLDEVARDVADRSPLAPSSAYAAADLLWTWWSRTRPRPCYRQDEDPRWRAWLAAFASALDNGYTLDHIELAISHLDDEAWMVDRTLQHGAPAFLELMPGLVMRWSRRGG